MNRFLSLAILALTQITFAATDPIKVGETVPNLCWKDLNESKLCLEQDSQKIRVLVYGSGWCPDCNKDMAALVAKVGEFQEQGVVFYNLLAEGFNHKDAPDTKFLKAWAEKYHIPFAVAASAHDPGNLFFEAPHYIPNYVIVGGDGKLLYKNNEAELSVVLDALRKILESQKI